MKNKEKKIEKLLNLYMEGRTSNEQENFLAEYFCNNASKIPPKWQVYRAMFAYISAEKKSHLPQPTLSRHFRARHTLRYVAAASAALILILSGMYFRNQTPKNYAVIDCNIYTDKNIIQREAMNALNNIDLDTDNPFSALETLK